MTRTTSGAIGVAAASAVTVLMFLVVAVARGTSTGATAVEQASTVGAVFVFLAVMGWIVRPALEPLGRSYIARGSLEPPMFAAVMAVVLTSSWVAHELGVSVIVGAFVAGIILPERAAMYREFSQRLGDLTVVVLLPVFLAFSGLRTDFTTLGVAAVGGVGLFVFAGVTSKWLGALLAARASGLEWAEGHLLGALMNCRGLLVLVVGLLALDAEVITTQLHVAAVVMALVTTMMTGPLVDRQLARSRPEPALDGS